MIRRKFLKLLGFGTATVPAVAVIKPDLVDQVVRCYTSGRHSHGDAVGKVIGHDQCGSVIKCSHKELHVGDLVTFDTVFAEALQRGKTNKTFCITGLVEGGIGIYPPLIASGAWRNIWLSSGRFHNGPPSGVAIRWHDPRKPQPPCSCIDCQYTRGNIGPTRGFDWMLA